MPTTLLKHKTLAKTPNRIFHHIKGDKEGSIMVFFAGIHGNEFAGVEALNRALKSINPSSVKGEIYGVYGNIKALQKKKRYIQSDLNRLWTSKQLKALIQKEDLTDEEIEQEDLLNFINQLLQTTHKPIYFIDLHTTSSKSLPFITINDALINRKFSNCFPLPVVLGIEEYLEGPLLSYLNTLGYVSLGFEGGQHEDPQAVKSCEAFVLLALDVLGYIKVFKYRNF